MIFVDTNYDLFRMPTIRFSIYICDYYKLKEEILLTEESFQVSYACRRLSLSACFAALKLEFDNVLFTLLLHETNIIL